MTSALRRLGIGIMVIIVTIASFVMPISASDGEIAISVALVNGNSVDMFYGGGAPIFNVKLENNSAESYTAVFSCNVTDSDGRVVWSKEAESISFPSKISIFKKFSPEIYEYGCYTFTATLKYGSNEITAMEKFSRSAENMILEQEIGVCTHMNNQNAAETPELSIDTTVPGGFGWVRDDVRWNFVEPHVPGQYVYYDELKNSMEKYLRTGTKVLLVLNHHNFLYRSDGGMVYEDDHIEAYANYCAYIAGLFKGNPNVAYELGNEPDNDDFSEWSALGGSAGEDYLTFAKLTKAGAEAIRKVDENAVIIAGALCSLQDTKSRDFLSGMLSVAGVLDKVDGFSFHPYNYWNGKLYCDEQHTSGMGIIEQIEYARQKLTLAGKPNMPIWITEYGTPSYIGNGCNYTEREQAANLTRAAAVVKSNSLVDKLMIYNLREKTRASVPTEQKFGIVTGDYGAKPAYTALSFMNSVTASSSCTQGYHLTGSDYVAPFGGIRLERTIGGEKEETFMLWEKSGKTAVVSVSDSLAIDDDSVLVESGNNITINIPKDKAVKYYDILGNEIGASDVMELTNEPVYIVVGAKDGVSVTDDGRIVCRGRTEKPETAVTVTVRNKSEFINKIIAVGQTKSGKDGSFEIEISVSDIEDKYCQVYIYEGANGFENYIGAAKYCFDTKQYVNGTECYTFDDLQIGDELRLKSKVYDLEKRDKNITIYNAGYGEDGTLKRADVHEVSEWTNNEAELELVIPTDEVIKFFVWEDSVKPAARMSVID